MWSQVRVKGHTQTTPLGEMDTAKAQILTKEVDNLVAKGAITECVDDGGGFVSPLFLVPKSDGSWRPVINLRDFNLYVACSLSLQDGIGKDHHTERRLDAEVGPKGCLPLCAHSPCPPEVPQVSVGRQAMAVQSPALWSEQCTPNVHQADEASRFHTEETGVPPHHLPGRHADDGPHQGGGQEGSGSSNGISLFSGVHHQHEEERLYSSPNHRVSGIHSGFSLDDYQPTTARDKEVSRATPPPRVYASPATSPTARDDSGGSSSSPASPTPLKVPEEGQMEGRAGPEGNGETGFQCSTRPPVVDRLSGQLQREAPPDPQV